jgi:hypothetical protein
MRRISLSPPARFLLRGSLLIAALLTLWWLVLFNPLLGMLRDASELSGALLFSGPVPFHISETAAGDWTFRVPVDALLRDGVERRIHSIDFDLARADAGSFTFSLPVFWALMLAAPGLRRNRSALLWGTLLMAALEVALVLITADISAYSSLGQLMRLDDPARRWMLRFAGYLSVNAAPYVLPFAAALWLHRDLRIQILEGSGFAGGADKFQPGDFHSAAD